MLGPHANQGANQTADTNGHKTQAPSGQYWESAWETDMCSNTAHAMGMLRHVQHCFSFLMVHAMEPHPNAMKSHVLGM